MPNATREYGRTGYKIFDCNIFRAEEIGIRLEIVGGLPMWDSHPPYRPQKAVTRIRARIDKLPRSAFIHVRRDGVTRQISPVQINLKCGCRCTV